MSAIADFKKMEVGQTFGTGLPAPSEGPPRLIFAQKERVFDFVLLEVDDLHSDEDKTPALVSSSSFVLLHAI
ncbi:hypothetical protein TNCV_2600441 [Trichonephila clavipes]|nr:hypothetical protein TNCV_2600441 [Trichonephila clavipes]